MNAPFDRTGLQRVIAIINGKGGVGKTTMTANIGGLLAESGWRTLVVDLDPQGGLGQDFGYIGSELDDEGRSLSQALMFHGTVVEPVKGIRDNLDVLVGGHYMETASISLAARGSRAGVDARMAVAEMLSLVAHDYDVIIIDCPPVDQMLQTAALAAARYALIPTKTDGGSINGLKITAGRFAGVVDLNPDLDLLGIVIFGSNTSARAVRASAINEITDALGGEQARPFVFETFVRHAESPAKKAREEGMLVHELETEIKNGPKWFEKLRKGEKGVSAGPVSTMDLAGDMQQIAAEVVARITAAEEKEASHV